MVKRSLHRRFGIGGWIMRMGVAGLLGVSCAPPEPSTYIIYVEAEKSLTSVVEKFAPVARIDRGESVLDDGVPVGFEVGKDGASYVSLGFEGHLSEGDDPLVLTLHDRKVDLVGVKLARARNNEGVLTRDSDGASYPDSDEDGVENVIELYLGFDPVSKGQRPGEDQAQRAAEEIFPELAAMRAARSAGTGSAGGSGPSIGGVDTRITSKPSKPVSTDAATIRFVAVGPGEGARFECSVDDGAFVECVSPLALSGLGEGSHPVRVRSVTSEGQVDTTPAEAVIVVDRTPPATRLTGVPSGVKNDGKVSLTFESSEAGSGFLCSVDSSPLQACAPGQGLSVGSDGRHTIRVYAVDAAGNRDPIGAETAVEVDLTPPAVKWIVKPPAVTNRTDLGLRASAEDRGGVADVECTIRKAADDARILSSHLSSPPERSGGEDPSSAGSWVACGSETVVQGLEEGSFVAVARARDKAGNISAAIESAFSVDLTPPKTTIKKGPDAVTSAKQVAFVLEGAEDVAGFRCGLDGDWSPCGMSWSVPEIAEGRHSAQVEAVDQAGNAGRSELYPFTIDRSAPEIRLLSGPAEGTNQSSVGFRIGITDALSGGASLECSADGSAFGDCFEKAVSFSNLTTGVHTLAVRGSDRAGNGATRTFSFLVDRTAPTVGASVGSGWLKSPAVVTFTAGDDSGVAPAVEYCFALGTGTCIPSVLAVEGAGQIGCDAGGVCEGNVRFAALDRAGNRSEAAQISANVDAQGPTADGDVTFSVTGTTGGSVSAKWRDAGVADVRDCLFEFSDAAGVTNLTKPAVGGVCSASRACARKGPLAIGLVALDAVGNASVRVERSLTCDASAPATSVVFGAEVKVGTGRFIDGGPAFSTKRYAFAVNDGDGIGGKEIHTWVTGMASESVCSWTAPGGCGFDVTCSMSTCLGSVRFYSVDLFDNEETPKTLSYTIDRKGPTFAFVADGEAYGRDASVLSSKAPAVRGCGNFYASDTTTSVARYEAGLSQGVTGCGRSDVAFFAMTPVDAQHPGGCIGMAGRPTNNRYCFTVKAFDEFGNVGCSSSCDRESGVYFFDNGGLEVFSPAEVVVHNRNDGTSEISVGGTDRTVRYNPSVGVFEKVIDLIPPAAGPEALRMAVLDDGCVQVLYETSLPTEVRSSGCRGSVRGTIAGAEALLAASKGSYWVISGENSLIGYGASEAREAIIAMADVLPQPRESLAWAMVSTSSSSATHTTWVAASPRSGAPGSAFSIRRITHPSHEISILDGSALADGENTYALEGIALAVVQEAGESIVVANGVRQTGSGPVRKLFYGVTSTSGALAMKVLGDGSSGYPVVAVLPSVCGDLKRVVLGVGSTLFRAKLDLGSRTIIELESMEFPGWVFQSLAGDVECQVYGTVIVDNARYLVTP